MNEKANVYMMLVSLVLVLLDEFKTNIYKTM